MTEDFSFLLLTFEYQGRIENYARLSKVLNLDPVRLFQLNRIYKYDIETSIKLLQTEVTPQNERNKNSENFCKATVLLTEAIVND